MNTNALLLKVVFITILIFSGISGTFAATLTQQENWNLFSAPGEVPVEDSRLLSAFNPALGTLTQVDWIVDASILANFNVPATQASIDYAFAAVVTCGVVFSPSAIFGCDLISPANLSDSRTGATLPISGPIGINETISLGYSAAHTFTDPSQLGFFIGTNPLLLGLGVQTFASAEFCFPDPFGPGEVCNPVPVNYMGDFIGELSVTYTYDPVAAVIPLPASIWLFGSTLIGFVGYSRRRKIA